MSWNFYSIKVSTMSWNFCVHDVVGLNTYQLRGNVTAMTRYLLTNGTVIGSITTYVQYDLSGNVVKAIDGRGQPSTIFYTDNFSDGVNRNTFAFPTQTTSAIPDPDNMRATNTPLTTAATYDFSTGKPTAATDANNQTVTFTYDDPLDRLTYVSRPDGGWTSYFYGRNGYGDYVHTRTKQTETQTAEAYQYFDGLGRSVRSLQWAGGSDWITADRQYDSLGRLWRVSANSYYSTGAGSPVNPSGQWVTSGYDSLGRVRTVTTADGAVVRTDYDGTRVLVTEQAGKQRLSQSDALGRPTDVWEITAADAATEAVSFPGHAGVTAGYRTRYLYDAVGNLRRVTQDSQQRYFMYDSLSRLIRARHPEQETNGNLALADTFIAPGESSPNSQWSLSYGYDPNGNLTTRTDARNITTSYQYDNLNRVIRTDYSDGTPFTLFTYDFSTNGRGRFHADYESSTSGELNYVTAYDAVGRATRRETEFYVAGTGWTGRYVTTRAYDYAGHVTAQTYPSGHSVQYTPYDVAGRLKGLTGNLGDGVGRTYATGLEYDASSRLQREQFGTQVPLYHKRHYNVRGQLYDVRLSSVGDEWDWNRGLLVNHYGNGDFTMWGTSGPNNNGNVLRSHHYVPADDQVSSHAIFYADYQYDALNRLASTTEQRGGNVGWATTGVQAFDYDRFGNRTINAGPTYDLPEPQFAVNAATNRLGVPGGQAGVLSYDAAGNLTTDTYTTSTGGGTRTYDAEGRMTAAWGGGSQHLYTYNAAGQRARRSVNGVTTWHISGFDGELLAEYAHGAAPSTPQKEYGYRGGELLVTAEAPPVAPPPAIADSGFETPSVGTGYQYNPAGTAWSYVGGAGVAGNSSAFTSGNPPAPQGTQVAFLQGHGTISQSVGNFQAGQWH